MHETSKESYIIYSASRSVTPSTDIDLCQLYIKKKKNQTASNSFTLFTKSLCQLLLEDGKRPYRVPYSLFITQSV